MKPSPHIQARIDEAMEALMHRTNAAIGAPDLASAKRALSDVWFAVHKATETLNDAEREIRDEALARLNRRTAA